MGEAVLTNADHNRANSHDALVALMEFTVWGKTSSAPSNTPSAVDFWSA